VSEALAQEIFRVQPEEARGADEVQREEKGAQRLARVQPEIEGDDCESPTNLRAAAFRRGFRVGDHVEGEKIKAGRGECSEDHDFRWHMPADEIGADQCGNGIKAEKADNQRGAADEEDEERKGCGDEEESHREAASPLVGRSGGEKSMAQHESSNNAEERRVEYVLALVGEDVFGADAEKNREKEEIAIVRVIQQQGNGNAADIGAQREYQLAAAEEPVQENFQGTSGQNREQNLDWISAEPENRATEDCVEGEKSSEGNPWVRPGRKDPRTSRGRFWLSGYTQPTGKVQGDAHFVRDCDRVEFHWASPIAGHLEMCVQRIKWRRGGRAARRFSTRPFEGLMAGQPLELR